jgi:hypothetical protein
MMKKFILGLVLGLSFALTPTAFSSNSVSTTLFPSQFVFNGQTKTLGPEYEVLNYNGHTYVPVRFVAENMGATVGYDDNGALPLVSINYFPPNTTIYTDPNYASNVHVGNIQVKSSGDQSVINGLVTIDPGVSSKKNHLLAFTLHFLNDRGEEIGTAFLGITEVNEGEIHYFETKTNDNVSGYSDIQLYVDMVDYVRLKPFKP